MALILDGASTTAPRAEPVGTSDNFRWDDPVLSFIARLPSKIAVMATSSARYGSDSLEGLDESVGAGPAPHPAPQSSNQPMRYVFHSVYTWNPNLDGV